MSRESEELTEMADLGSEGDVLREMVVEAVKQCTDASLLDLVYKILVISA